MGRPPIKKSGPMTAAERQRKRRRELARERKRENPKLKAKQARRAEREAELGLKITALPDARFGVIYADPPWRFEVWSRETGLGRDATNHYPTSELDAIMALDAPSISADNAVCFMWATVPMLPHALEVMEAWGFTYKTHFIWAKDCVGTGYWNRNQHEILLVGTRGDIPVPAPGMQWPSVIEAPRGAHSEKPEIFYRLIEAYFPNLPKIELYARKRRPGWTAWGTLEHQPPDHVGLSVGPTPGVYENVSNDNGLSDMSGRRAAVYTRPRDPDRPLVCLDETSSNSPPRRACRSR